MKDFMNVKWDHSTERCADCWMVFIIFKMKNIYKTWNHVTTEKSCDSDNNWCLCFLACLMVQQKRKSVKGWGEDVMKEREL